MISLRVLCVGRAPLMLSVPASGTIFDIKTAGFAEELAAGRRVILIRRGIRLIDNHSIEQYNIMNGETLHCSVGSSTSRYAVADQGSADSIAPVVLALILIAANSLAVAAVIIPSSRSTYFTPFSTAALIVLTFIIVPISAHTIVTKLTDLRRGR
uniref:Ubiquitin-like domain-containing protein n=1 Tax=Spongospora subterranea TaxID=70186 RepID=A0A0H5RMM7_9EUKA|eukprot:CRZ09974.1 hypothetical protein [Spongospora subterranea]